jgi:hypothetical protein
VLGGGGEGRGPPEKADAQLSHPPALDPPGLPSPLPPPAQCPPSQAACLDLVSQASHRTRERAGQRRPPAKAWGEDGHHKRLPLPQSNNSRGPGGTHVQDPGPYRLQPPHAGINLCNTRRTRLCVAQEGDALGGRGSLGQGEEGGGGSRRCGRATLPVMKRGGNEEPKGRRRVCRRLPAPSPVPSPRRNPQLLQTMPPVTSTCDTKHLLDGSRGCRLAIALLVYDCPGVPVP